MADNNRQRRKEDEIAFGDSWKQQSVELATGAAIIAGIADVAMRGNVSGLFNSGKKAIKQAGKGLDRYVNRKAGLGVRTLKNVGVKTVNKLKNDYHFDASNATNELNAFGKNYRNTLENEDMKRRVENEVNKRMRDTEVDALLEHQRTNPAEPFKFDNQKERDIMAEKIRTQWAKKETEKELGKPMQNAKPFSNKNKKKNNFNEMKDQFTSSAIVGMGLASGVTALHALDKMVNPNENNKKKDQSFEVAGSLLRKKDKNMKKEAGVRELYEGLAGIAGNTPKAIATGVGYTGVSLGTAKMLNDQKEQQKQKEDPNKKNSRIIIELGQQENEDNSTHATRNTSLSLLPKPNDLQHKLASEKTAGFSGFLKNVGGRSGEITNLERRINEQTVNYRDEAANLLKNQDIGKKVHEHYGNIIFKGDSKIPYNGSEDFMRRELLDSEAKRLQRVDRAKLEGVKDEVANARMKAIGGLGAIGATGGLLGAMRKDDPNEQQN